jgi:hypothetical protein
MLCILLSYLLETFIYIPSDEFVIILRAFDEFVTQGKLNAMHLIVIFARTCILYLITQIRIYIKTILQIRVIKIIRQYLSLRIIII